jgi:2-methylcitrate synthase
MSEQVMTPPVPKKKSVQLSGVVAGSTAISAVGPSGNDLRYRGYDINDLAQNSTFEEVAYLLIYGQMPNQLQFSRYKADPRCGPSHGCAAHRLFRDGHSFARER